MLTHSNPVESANYLADYVNANVNTFPEHLQLKALDAVRRISPVERLVYGMELLFALALQEDDVNERSVALNALYSVSLQVAEGGFFGKGDRAVAIMKYARHEGGEWPFGLDAPEAPVVDAGYAPPVPVAPIPGVDAPADPSADGETPQLPAPGDGEGV